MRSGTVYARQGGSSLCRLISRAERAPQPCAAATDELIGPPADLSICRTHTSPATARVPCAAVGDLLFPAFPAFETRSSRLDGSTRRLTLTYSTSTTRRRRASHSQRGSRRLRGEVPHRKVEYFHTATIDGNVHTRRPRFHDRASVLKKEPPIAKSYRLLEGHLSSVFHPADNDTFW